MTEPGLKTSQIQPCAICAGPINPAFFTVRINQHIVKPTEANRAMGLAQMLGGSQRLAEAFTGDEEVTARLPGPEIIVCTGCLIDGNAVIGRLLVAYDEGDDDGQPTDG